MNDDSQANKTFDGNTPEIKLIEIGGGRNSKKNFFDDKGFVYSKSNSSDTTYYFRCKNKKLENCKARVVCRGKNLDECVLMQQHSHDPKISSLDKVKFSKKLEEIQCESPFKKGQEVYNEAKKALRGHVNMDHIPERERFDSFLHRKQKKHIPLLANTIEEFEALINDPKYSPHYMYDERRTLFYHGVWRNSTGANVVFISDTVLEAIRKEKNIKLLMDGTFKALPLHIKFRQLYIISVIIQDKSYPLAYILMTKRDTSSYELILTKLKAMFPSVNVECCMSDYEAATRKAIRIVFPSARLAGCYFHYVQAIVKAFKRFGLKNDEKFDNVRQQVSVLALLPNEYVSIGFETISKNFKKSIRWNRFAEYWLRQWAPANISVYGLKDRTNNFAESLNKTINSILKASHPHIWLLIENLRMVEMNKSDELKKVEKGYMIKEKEPKLTELNKKIERATAKFEQTKDVKSFLKNVTFNENMESYFKERIPIGVDDSGMNVVDDYDDDDFDETIIANDFDVVSNFRAKFPRAATKRKSNCNEKISKKRKQ
ncbi:uncharacterized protein LOC119072663 [Bradysia coprophila]|uniref:uncharacterized protein LOC119072663 n=1 Tax=Bradysia coprophila TaxID=38358 RepID=UPI00187DA5EE|nr:uncharacterized protein LOC119072663 [Bradysia coprophila]